MVEKGGIGAALPCWVVGRVFGRVCKILLDEHV